MLFPVFICSITELISRLIHELEGIFVRIKGAAEERAFAAQVGGPEFESAELK